MAYSSNGIRSGSAPHLLVLLGPVAHLTFSGWNIRQDYSVNNLMLIGRALENRINFFLEERSLRIPHLRVGTLPLFNQDFILDSCPYSIDP